MKNLVSVKLNTEFKRAYYRGAYKAHPYLVSYVMPNGKGKVRVGITTGKKVGGAVARNRARRVIRAAYLSIRDELSFPRGVDLIFVAREKTPTAKSTEVAKAMKKQLLYLSENLPTKGKKR